MTYKSDLDQKNLMVSPEPIRHCGQPHTCANPSTLLTGIRPSVTMLFLLGHLILTGSGLYNPIPKAPFNVMATHTTAEILEAVYGPLDDRVSIRATDVDPNGIFDGQTPALRSLSRTSRPSLCIIGAMS